nr:First part of SEC-A motif NERD protein [uncultured bacterium]
MVFVTEDVRIEADIFDELAEVCSSPGYVHAIAYLCFRDNTIKYSDKVTTDAVLQQFSMDRLVRTEISTLIGLTCKTKIDLSLPSPDVIQKYIDKTDGLLKEIHQSMMVSPSSLFDPDKIGDNTFNPFTNGDVLRETIFYGGEAAYHFQYRDLSKEKYKKDNDWFVEKRGFSIQQAIDDVTSIQTIQGEKINDVMEGLVDKDPSEWSFLPAYTFSLEEVSNIANIDTAIAKSVVDSFVAPVDMASFGALDDFNPINAYPIIKVTDNEYLLFQHYSLVEALYETPFFWFNSDDEYKQNAMRHRGEFTEEFSADRLKLVFGEKRVFSNIDIYDSKNIRAGEIDVLVVFANRAIILQAKSKNLL